MSTEPARPPFFKHFVSWLGIAAGTLLARLPWAIYRPMAWLLARLMRLFMRRRAHIARTNIRMCFPEYTPAQQARLYRASFDALAFSLFEFCRSWWGQLRAVDTDATIEGLENLQNAAAKGKGVLLLAAHFMTMEYCVKILGQNTKLAGMYRPFDNPALEWSVLKARSSYTQHMFARDALRAVLRHLKSGGIVWMAPDQETRRGDSVYVPFFKQQAWSLTSTHQLAKLSGAAVVPFFHQRLANGNYRLCIEPALENFPGPSISDDIERVMAVFETFIRRCPEQYLWLHARFKRQPDGKDPYRVNQ